MSGYASPLSPPRVLSDVIPGDRVRDVLLVGGYSLAIGISAQIAIPLAPVPITGQTFAVLLGAILLGMTRASIGGALYLSLGLAGIPWFTSAGGATLGYIVGFVAAAAVVGSMAERGHARSPLSVALTMAVGNVVIYVFGVTVLAIVLGMGPGAALSAGVVPFLVGDALKIAAATALVPVAWKAVGGRDDGPRA